jgi:uncharacterized membrane protein
MLEQIIVPLHIASILFVLFFTVRADHMGLRWIMGKDSVLNPVKVERYHKMVWIGLGALIVTGITLFIPLRDYLLTNPRFFVKMWFVGMLVINGVAIGILSKVAVHKSFKELSQKTKIQLFATGAISTICWLGAILGGIFLIPD